ncbi:uncharacterized protein G2W53_028099 [Senna tora]|uniref:Uncharacterized protein n=1 Tax=Senna tora TaxID=362788 RepID=A0A834W8D5_9FABA|nr:uncharacterized protein G2W53_028099 [Senna tora]
MSFVSDLHNHSRARRLIVFDTLRIVSILPRDSLLKSQGLNKVLEDAGAVIRYSLENLAEIIGPNMPQSNSDGIPSPVLDESLWRDMFHLIEGIFNNIREYDKFGFTRDCYQRLAFIHWAYAQTERFQA